MQSRSAGGDGRRRDVERSVADREVDAVEPAGECRRGGHERRPPEHDAGDEREERDGADPHAELPEHIVAARHWQRDDAEQARGAAEPRR